MVRKSNSEWRPVQLPKDLVDEVERAIKTDRVKKEGITSISQFISRTVNDKIQELEQKRFSLINTHDDHLKILDNKIGELGKIVSVHFTDDNSMWCEYCDKTSCIHVQYAKEIPYMKANTKESTTEKITHENNFRSIIVKDNYIQIFDDGLRNGTPVKVVFDDKKLYCDECQSYNCNHVKHIWSVDHIAGQLEERGFSIVERTCPKCGTVAYKSEIENVFGYRKSNGKTITQSWCRYCRTQERKEKKKIPRIDKYF